MLRHVLTVIHSTLEKERSLRHEASTNSTLVKKRPNLYRNKLNKKKSGIPDFFLLLIALKSSGSSSTISSYQKPEENYACSDYYHSHYYIEKHLFSFLHLSFISPARYHHECRIDDEYYGYHSYESCEILYACRNYFGGFGKIWVS